MEHKMVRRFGMVLGGLLVCAPIGGYSGAALGKYVDAIPVPTLSPLSLLEPVQIAVVAIGLALLGVIAAHERRRAQQQAG